MYKLLLYHLINNKLLVITILTIASSWCVCITFDLSHLMNWIAMNEILLYRVLKTVKMKRGLAERNSQSIKLDAWPQVYSQFISLKFPNTPTHPLTWQVLSQWGF